jgi:hypothetical protein
VLVFAKFSFKVYIEILEKFNARYRTILFFVPGIIFDSGLFNTFDIGNGYYPDLVRDIVFNKALSNALDDSRSQIRDTCNDVS